MTRPFAYFGLSLLALGGCSTPSWLCIAPPGPDKITLVATPDANDDTAIAIDLVYVSDQLAAQQIAALSADAYFARKSQLIRDFPAGLKIHGWELAPGQLIRDAPADPSCNRINTLVFARYTSPGAHRQALDGKSSVIVSLGSKDFTVSP